MKVMPLGDIYRISLEIEHCCSALAGSLKGKLEGLMPFDGTYSIPLEIATHGPVFEGSRKVSKYATLCPA